MTMTQTAVLEETSVARSPSWLETIWFHLTLVALPVALQIASVPTREMSADNSWHFCLARDILTGQPIWWSAVDANRLFPDLLFSLAAFVLPFGSDYTVWLFYYHAIFVLALYASLVALGAALTANLRERRVFVFLATVALSLFMLALPYWDTWLAVPGNHGGGVPVGFLCLALLLQMNKSRKVNLAGAVSFVLAASLLVGSNRVLLVTFMAPLLLALLLGLAARWRIGRMRLRTHAAERADETGGPLGRLAIISGIAALGGCLAWPVLADLSWHKLRAPARLPPISPSLDWLSRRIDKEAAEFTATALKHWDIPSGLALLAIAVAAAAFLFAYAQRKRIASRVPENRVIFGVFAGLSAILAMAFVLVVVDDRDTWHYRFIAVSSAFAVAFLASLPLWFGRLIAPRAGLAIPRTAVLAGLIACAFFVAEGRRIGDPTHTETAYKQSITALAQMIGRHADHAKLRGIAEYWIADDVTSRSDVLQVLTLDAEKPRFRFYNNNAADLCHDDYFYVLYTSDKDEPRKADLIALLGEPIASETMQLGRSKVADVLYYDPAVITTRILLPAREEAARLFPSFKCGS